jgi:hypothetical protein
LQEKRNEKIPFGNVYPGCRLVRKSRSLQCAVGLLSLRPLNRHATQGRPRHWSTPKLERTARDVEQRVIPSISYCKLGAVLSAAPIPLRADRSVRAVDDDLKCYFRSLLVPGGVRHSAVPTAADSSGYVSFGANYEFNGFYSGFRRRSWYRPFHERQCCTALAQRCWSKRHPRRVPRDQQSKAAAVQQHPQQLPEPRDCPASLAP